jgi:hypothetical protein
MLRSVPCSLLLAALLLPVAAAASGPGRHEFHRFAAVASDGVKGGTVPGGSNRMTATPYLPTADLFVRGRTEVAEQVAEQSRQSLPVPRLNAARLEFVFFYSPSQAVPGAVRMTPPDRLARLDPVSGSLLGLVAVDPATFGLADLPGALLGSFTLAPGTDAPAYIAQRTELFRRYDRLLPAFVRASSAPDASLRAEAREFLRLFAAVHEPPVSAYYEAIGREFLAWVRASAQ